MRTLTALLLLAACPSPDEVLVEPTLGVDASVPAAAGEARAGVIVGSGGLFAGIGAEGQEGDLKIYNAEVQFIVSAPGRRHGWIDVGGTLVDADLVRADGVPGRDGLEDAFLSFGVSRLFEADEVLITADGSDGGPAVVTTRGRDVEWDFFSRGLETPPFIPAFNLAIERRYELAPDSPTLRIVTTFTNEGLEAISALPAEGQMASKEDFAPWYGEKGLVDSAGGEVTAAGFWGLRNEGVYSVWSDAGPMRVSPATSLLAIASLTLLNHERVELEPGESTTRVANITLGPDTASTEAARRAAQGEAVGAVLGTVTSGGQPLAGARVHFVDGERFGGFAVTGADGGFHADLPAGGWQAWVTARHPEDRVVLPVGPGRYGPMAHVALNAAHLEALSGQADSVPIPLAGGRLTPEAVPIEVEAGGEASLDFELPAASILEVVVTDGERPAPAALHIQRSEPPDPLDGALLDGLGLRSSPLVARVWTRDGRATVEVPPGSYVVTAGHSWRHERGSQAIDVAAGASASVGLTLPEAVERGGWFSLDAHLHAAPSMDGRTAMEDRLVACAASGVDFPVTTDHDRFADYRPLATALGLDPLMQVIPGTEITTVIRGHWNLFPVEPVGQAARNGGGLIWWDRALGTTDDLAVRMRGAGLEGSLLQVNHGRLALGMMDAAGYQPGSGAVANEDLWTWDFDQLEIITADGHEDWIANRDDWFSFLSQGQIKVPVGSSDTHDLHRACGLGHTDLFLGVESLDEVGPEEALAALAAGRVVVASGVTLRADANGELPGSTVTGSAITLSIAVQGPAWIQPEVLRIWRNGQVDAEIALGALPVQETRVLTVDEDSWIAVEVDGGPAQGHAWGGHAPYALSNAFFVDVAGDGWTAPGL